MIRIKDTKYPSTAALLADAIRIAEYYGFVPLEELPKFVASVDSPVAKKIAPASEIESLLNFARKDERGLPGIARKALLSSRRDGEALFAWRTVQQGGSLPGLAFELHVFGHASAMAEALLIVVGNAIAENAGVKERVLSVNNIGSAESSGRYVRDVGQYLRKHIETISPTLRPRAATDPLGTLVQLIERGHPGIARAPQAMEYLTEDERRRFWEFLEYLEVFGLPYELNGQVLGSRDVWSHSLYTLSTNDTETQARIPFAFGGRYDPVISRLAKKPDSAAMIGINLEIRGSIRPKKNSRQIPGIFFAHLGAEARRRALSVIEHLRGAEIPVHQSLTYERLGEQMSAARRLGVPYILIMGHKEAIENAVLVREVATNSQEQVPITDLSGYLRRRRMGSRIEAHA
jgi:histidyl-tRNA synthetase